MNGHMQGWMSGQQGNMGGFIWNVRSRHDDGFDRDRARRD